MTGNGTQTGTGSGVGHGKIILLGEHSVVHGKPALAAPLQRGCRAEARAADRDVLRVLPWGIEITPDPNASGHDAQLKRAFFALLDALGDGRHHEVDATLEIPAGAGLGASAALSVAIVRAIDAAAGRTRSDADVVTASVAWEREFHGNPSGVDSAIAVHGKVSLFYRGKAPESVVVGRPLWLVVGHSGQAPSTKRMVESVARQLERAPEKVRKILDGMEAVVNNGRSALVEGNLRNLGQLMVLNQKLLNSLMLSTTRLEEMCQCATGAGAMGAKLTGGGGGGCMIALSDSVAGARRVEQALGRFDADAFSVEIS